MRKSYLSIDMDFWNNHTPRVAENDVRAMIGTLHRRGVPLVATMSHQQLLPFVNDSMARVLKHLDQHSDLVEVNEANELTCGTWVAYVRWRKEGKFHWFRWPSYYDEHDNEYTIGDCSYGDLFLGGKWGRTDWEEIDQTEILRPDVRLLTHNCVGAGLVLSPHYVRKDLEPVFRRVVSDFKIKYLKGRRDEEYRRACRPSGRKSCRVNDGGCSM